MKSKNKLKGGAETSGEGGKRGGGRLADCKKSNRKRRERKGGDDTGAGEPPRWAEKKFLRGRTGGGRTPDI